VLTDVLNKAYSDFVFVRDAKDAAYLFLKFDEAHHNSVSVLSVVKELLKHRFHLVLGSSLEVGTSEDGLLSFLYRSEDIVEIHLIKPIVKPLTVSIVEIGLSDLAVVAVSSAGSTDLARCTSRGAIA
jgi:hypothetical protein